MKNMEREYNSYMENEYQLTEKKVKAKDLPQIAVRFLQKYHKGGSMHYAMELFKKMYDAGEEVYLAITERESIVKYRRDIYMSVCYKKDGEWIIADPAKAVAERRTDVYDAIPMEEYKKTYGTIWLYDPYGEYGEKLFFEGFLNHPKETFYSD